MTWFFWLLPIMVKFIIGLYFVLEGLYLNNKGPHWWLYAEMIAGGMLACGLMTNWAVLVLFYVNNVYLLKQNNDYILRLNRLLIINGLLILLFNPHWLNSLIIYLQRSYIYHD